MAVVQDPADALYPEMPQNALRRIKNIDFSVPIAALAPLLVKLAHEPIKGVKEATGVDGKENTRPGDSEYEKKYFEQLRIENDFALGDIPNFEIMQEIGKPATIACPECHGTLWEVNDEEGEDLRFRCRIGHAYTALSLLTEHTKSVQNALWVALRTLEESVSLNRRLAERAQDDRHLEAASRFMENAAVSEQHLEIIKRVLLQDKGVN